MPFPELTPTIPVLLRRTAERFGDKPLLIADGRELSYAAADHESSRLALGLLRQGIGKGMHVGILMPNTVDWAIAWFAVTRIGAIAVPINTFYRAAELAWTVRHADLACILTQSTFRNNDFLQRLEDALPGLDEEKLPSQLFLRCAPLLRTIIVWGPCDRTWATPNPITENAATSIPLDDAFLVEVEESITPADPVVIIYTSGSSGDPKGPVHSHGALVRHTYNLTFLYVVTTDDVLFTSMPFFWVGGLITGIHAVIHHGATLVTQSAFDAEEALDLIEKYGATITLGWPQQGKTIAEHPSFSRRDLSKLRRTSMPAMVPESALPPPIHSDSLGMTELCGNHLGVDPYIEQPPSRQGTYGPSIEGLEHKIVDPVTGAELERGTVGEIAVRGYSLMQRLHKREREETFTPDGFYRTGDGGFMDHDGWVTFTGRIGELIKTSGGTNVTPAEVESALLGLEGVLEAYVTALGDRDGQVVVAAVVAKTGEALTEDGLRAELREVISAYKVPKHIWVANKSELPFTDTGKIKKKDLGQLIADKVDA